MFLDLIAEGHDPLALLLQFGLLNPLLDRFVGLAPCHLLLPVVDADRVDELDDFEDAGVAHLLALRLHQGLGWRCLIVRILLPVFELLELLYLICVIDELRYALNQATYDF